MKLLPPQRLALIAVVVTSIPLAWFILRYTDPRSMDPWAEVRIVLKNALWMETWADGPLRWTARAWLVALLVTFFYPQLTTLVRRARAWVMSGT